MDISIRRGTTSKRIAIKIINATTGEGLTGLNSTNLECYYWRESQGNVDATSINLATTNRGTYVSGGFVQKDAISMKGWYEFGIPNAVLASGATWAKIMFFGATNMVPVDINIELDAVKNVAIPERTQALPSITPDYDEAIMLSYMKLRNEGVSTDTEERIKNDAGTVIVKATKTKTSTQFTKGKLQAGP